MERMRHRAWPQRVGAAVTGVLWATSALGEEPAPQLGQMSAGARGSLNPLVIEAILDMPEGGNYSAGRVALEALGAAISSPSGDGPPEINPSLAQPSFCSGATYLVFLKVLARLQASGRLRLGPNAWEALRVRGQRDGEGVWGRWNANGPGTARLFYELGLGSNFLDWSEARTGDFMKIFWNEHIGAKESGHSVVYLGRSVENNGPVVRYWSSNQDAGYGFAQVPQDRVKRVVFSRLTSPEGIIRAGGLPQVDRYLGSLLTHASPEKDMLRLIGLQIDGGVSDASVGPRGN